MPIAEIGWPLLRWVRYAALNHVVRVFAGSVFRSTPVCTFYLRLNGARVGRHVYVNALAIMDHDLIELDEDAVVGSDVSLSGHTVEGGVVRTAAVRIGRGATIGIGSGSGSASWSGTVLTSEPSAWCPSSGRSSPERSTSAGRGGGRSDVPE